MNKIAMLAAVLFTVVGGSAALAQTTTAPNSGAGVPGLPGNKSGPAAKPGEITGVRSDQSKVPGLPGNKSGPALQPSSRLQNRAQGNEEEAEDQDGLFHHRPAMMGIMGRSGRAVTHPTIMRIIFSIIDANGDGKLTLEEWQAAQERIFKAMDTDHDGTVTFEEMQAFMRGR